MSKSNHEKLKELPNIMIPDLVKALSRSEIDVNELKNLKFEFSNWLVKGRDSGDISTESYLSAGKIEGGIDVILAMIDHGAPKSEIQLHVDSVKLRIESISQ